MDLMQGDDAAQAAVVQSIDARIAGRAPVTAPVGNEEDITALAEKLPQLGLRAGPRLAAVVVENGGKRTAARRRVDEPAKLELAAGKGDLLRLSADCGARKEQEKEWTGVQLRLLLLG
jgi:hypothetical protein